jgi:gluconokinase
VTGASTDPAGQPGRAVRPERVIIGLDVGTTSVKAVAFAPDSRWRHGTSREYPLLRPVSGQEVQDPATVRAAAAAALTECVSGSGGAHVMAVSVSAAMHGLIALDEHQSPITPLITWADGRAAGVARSLQESGAARDLQASGGTPVHPGIPLTKIIWFARNDADTWRRARWWIGLKDYLLLWLTGTLATELSSASGTGLIDVSTREWNRVALGLCGVSEDHLPPILSPTAVLELAAPAASETGLRPGTPVVAGAADGPLANVGVGAITPGTAGLSLGTSGAVRMAVPGPRTDSGGRMFCYALTESIWVIGGAISTGGDLVRWIRQALMPDLTAGPTAGSADDAVLELAAEVEAGSNGLVMLPFLLPERAPLWRPGVAGAYLGLRRDHTRAHMVRAGVESVCFQMRLIIDRLDGVDPVRTVRATGGVFRSPLWRDAMAAAAGKPLYVMDEADGTALGAAALGLWALGAAPDLEAAVRQLQVGEGAPVEPPADMVDASARLRVAIPALLDALQRVVKVAGLQPD